MKAKLSILILLLFKLFFAQEVEIEYRVDLERALSDELKAHFKETKSREEANKEIGIYENPKSEYYELKLSNSVAELKYVESINNDLEQGSVQMHNFPLGKKSYRKVNDSSLYYEHSFPDKEYYSTDSLIDKNWVETGRDSVILGYKVKELTLKTNQGMYKAWYTTQLAKGLGLYNLNYDKGFIIAFELEYKPNRELFKNAIKVYPYKIKKLKKRNKVVFPSIDKIYTFDEIREMYSELNKLTNPAGDS